MILFGFDCWMDGILQCFPWFYIWKGVRGKNPILWKCWIGESTLAIDFPRLYRIANNHMVTFDSVITWSLNSHYSLNPSFRRNLSDREYVLFLSWHSISDVPLSKFVPESGLLGDSSGPGPFLASPILIFYYSSGLPSPPNISTS